MTSYKALVILSYKPKIRSNKGISWSFGHTRPIVDPKLILGIRITKPPWPSTVPPSLFSPIKRFSESDTKDQVRIRIRWKSVVCGWSLTTIYSIHCWTKHFWPKRFWGYRLRRQVSGHFWYIFKYFGKVQTPEQVRAWRFMENEWPLLVYLEGY